MQKSAIGWTAIVLLLCVDASPARAQDESSDDPETTTVLKTTVADSADSGLGGAIERTVRARLDALGAVETAGTPGLGLEDLQLAVGCVGETAECLGAVADQLEVQALLLSSLDRADDTLVLTLTLFRTSDGSMTEVVRRKSGQDADNAILEAIDGALREMFDLPPAPEPEEPEPATGDGAEPAPGTADDTATEPADDAAKAPGADDGLSPIPFAVGGAGVAALAVGIGFAVKSQSTEDDYANAPTSTTDEVDSALSTLDDAQRQARIGKAMLGVGSALVAAGAVLFIVMETGSSDERRVGVAPTVSPTAAGLVVTGRLGESL